MTNKEIIIRFYKKYLKKYLKKIFVALIFSLIVAGSTASIAWLLDPAIKKIFIEKNEELKYIIPFAIIIAFTFKGLSLYLARTTIITVGAEVEKELRNDMAHTILNADTQTLENKHSGKFIGHMLYDATLVTNLAGNTILSLMKDTLTLIGLICLMFYQNWRLALFAVIMIPLASFAAKSLGKRMGKVTTESQVVTGEMTTYLSEILKNSKIIKIYQKEKFEFERAKKFIDILKEKSKKISFVLVRATPVMEILTGIMIAGLIFYSSIMVVQGTLGINNFFSFLAAMMLSYQPVRSLATLNIGINQGISGARRAFAVIDEEKKIYNDVQHKDLIISKTDIEFKNVNFTYNNSNKEKVLKSLNLKIKGGNVAALVGHSGSGKTTIMNLIPRFYNASSGDIQIDNQSIYNVNLSSLRKNISLVSQDISLFDDTIIANIAYANSQVSKEKIFEACKFSSAHEFIEKLPKKYDTLIGENGVRLSGGEKQRLSIARAILKNTPIILLDEATSSLDSDTEYKIQEAIMYLTKNRTTIIIAHRLSTIVKADKIFVIEHGQVIAEGNHSFLLQNSSTYKNFYDKQLKSH